jgi:hypothetical protein
MRFQVYDPFNTSQAAGSSVSFGARRIELFGCVSSNYSTDYANTTLVEVALQSTADYSASQRWGASVGAAFYDNAGTMLGAAALLVNSRSSRFVQQAVLTGIPCTLKLIAETNDGVHLGSVSARVVLGRAWKCNLFGWTIRVLRPTRTAGTSNTTTRATRTGLSRWPCLVPKAVRSLLGSAPPLGT